MKKRIRLFLSLIVMCLCITLLPITQVKADTTISVMSYNIKNDNYSFNDISSMIKDANPDIVGMQELMFWQEPVVTTALNVLGYNCVKGSDRGDGEHASIYYKSDKFSVFRSGTFWLSDTPNEQSKFSDSNYYRICTWACLKILDSDNDYLLVMNTHLDFGNELAYKQMNVILDQIVSKTTDLPRTKNHVIVMGDLNTGSTSAPFKYFLGDTTYNGQVNTKTQQRLDESRQIASQVVLNSFGNYFTQAASNPTSDIDHIIVSHYGFDCTYYQVLSNAAGSDHLPILAKLYYKSAAHDFEYQWKENGKHGVYCPHCGYTTTGNCKMSGGYCSLCNGGEAENFRMVTDVNDLTTGRYIMVLAATGTYPGSSPHYAVGTRRDSGFNAVVSYPLDFAQLPQTIRLAKGENSKMVWNLTGNANSFTLTHHSGKTLNYGGNHDLNYGWKEASTWSATMSTTTYHSMVKCNNNYIALRTDWNTIGHTDVQSPLVTCVPNTSTGNFRVYFYKQYEECLHTNTTTQTTNASCLEAGQIVTSCADCGEVIDRQTINALGHNYVAKSIAPTCTQDGKTTYTCTNCSDSYTETIKASGHNYVYTSTVAPTASEQGYDIYTCSNCGLTQNQNYTLPTGYDYTIKFSVPTGVTAIQNMVCNSQSSVKLPTPVGTPKYDTNNAVFFGWVTDAVNNAASVGTFYAAGSNYTPKGNITLYALYKISAANGISEFTVGSSGRYVLASVIGNTYYAMPNSFAMTSKKIYPSAITVTNGIVTDSNAASYALTLSYHNGYYTISNGTTYLAYSGSTNFSTDTTTAYEWTIAAGTKGTWRISETTSATPRAIALYDYNSVPRYGVYATSNLTANSTAYYEMEILPIADENANASTLYTTVFDSPCAHEQTETTTLAATCEEDGYVKTFCKECGNLLETTLILASGHNYRTDVTAPTCTEEGFTTYTCSCGDTYNDDYVAASGHSYGYVNNGQNHSYACANCGEGTTYAHEYVNGSCVCGAVEATVPEIEEVSTLTVTPNISIGAEIQVVYTIPARMVSSYAKFYVKVTKTVVGGEPIVTTYGLDEGMTEIEVIKSGSNVAGYRVTYTGIGAKNMGDEFTAQLFAVSTDGAIKCGYANTTSIKSYLMGKIEDASSLPVLKTLAVDMLNYGAAAQIYFGYDAANPVNADLTAAQKALGTTALPSAANRSAITGSGSIITPNVSVQNKVILSVTCMYKATDTTKVMLVIKDAETGTVLDKRAPSAFYQNACQGTFDGVGAKEMRRLLTIELYDGDTLVSRTLTWSVESYVADVRAKTTTTAAQLNMVNALLIYGDSAAAYLAK